MGDQIEVIIPSLGKKVLNNTIEKLNNGSIKPKNIIPTKSVLIGVIVVIIEAKPLSISVCP